jgi:tetratricopeptide (TPR) repeat protein
VRGIVVGATVVACGLGRAETAWAVAPSELAARARAAEARGELPEATRALEELLSAGVDSDDVLYNLGTLYARTERYGEAIWCFERVLLRAPGNLAARRNLRATRIRLARRDAARSGHAVVETQPSLWVQHGELLPYSVSVPGVLLTELLAVGAWVARRRATSELQRVAATAALALALLLGTFGLSVIAARTRRPDTAVVLHGGLRLLQAPRPDAIPEGAVREGERVEVLTRDGAFVRVRAPGGSMGWLASNDLGRL